MFRVRKSSVFLYSYLKEGLEKHKELTLTYPSKFIGGLFDSEGSFSSEEIRCRMSNKKILEWTQELLNQLDINSSISLEVERGKETNFYAQKMTINEPQYCLSIGSKKGLLKFAKSINSSIERKQDVLNQIVGSYS